MAPKKTVVKSKKILEAAVIARHFGFIPGSLEPVNSEDIKSIRSKSRLKDYLDEHMFPAEEAFAGLRAYKEKKDMSEPVLSYSEGGAAGKHHKHRKSSDSALIQLHIINVDSSVAEGSIIKTLEAILNDHGIKKLKIKLGMTMRKAVIYVRQLVTIEKILMN